MLTSFLKRNLLFSNFLGLLLVVSNGCSSAPVTDRTPSAVLPVNEVSAATVRCRLSEGAKEVLGDLNDKSEKKPQNTPQNTPGFSLSFFPGHPFPGEMKPAGFNQLRPKEEFSSNINLERTLRPAIFWSIHSSLEALADTPAYMLHLRATDEIEDGSPFGMTMDIRFAQSRKQVFNTFQCCMGGEIAMKEGKWACLNPTATNEQTNEQTN
jgi:hypothetical protein